MSGSDATLLSEVAELTVGYAFKSKEYSADHRGTRLVRGENVAPGNLRWDNVRWWPQDAIVDPKYELREGDIVIAMDRPWVEAGLKYAAVRDRDLPALLVQRVARLRAKAGTDQEYLYYALGGQQFTNYVRAVQTGTSIPHISGSQIVGYSLTPHSLPEQRAIASVLGALDGKIVANIKLAAIAENLAIALIAQESEVVPLGAVANLHRRTVSPTSIGEPLVAHFSLPAFDSKRQPLVESPREIKSAKFQLDRPVVLLSKLNPRFPRVWNVDELPIHPSLASTEFLVLESARAANEVLWAALSQRQFSLALDAKVGGTSGSHQRVRPADALDTPIINPESVSQNIAVEIVTVVKLATQLRRESGVLVKLRDTLLPELMSGRLRVKDAEKKIEEVV